MREQVQIMAYQFTTIWTNRRLKRLKNEKQTKRCKNFNG